MEKIALSVGGQALTGPADIPSAGYSDFGNLFKLIVNYLLLFAIIVLVIMLIWFAISWVTSGGDKQALQKARTKFFYIIVGIVIVIMSFAIISFMETLFGVNSGLTTP